MAVFCGLASDTAVVGGGGEDDWVVVRGVELSDVEAAVCFVDDVGGGASGVDGWAWDDEGLGGWRGIEG